jgi:hypothetical protein
LPQIIQADKLAAKILSMAKGKRKGRRSARTKLNALLTRHRKQIETRTAAPVVNTLNAHQSQPNNTIVTERTNLTDDSSGIHRFLVIGWKQLTKIKWLQRTVALLVIILSISLYFYLKRSEATTIRGRLNQLGDIEFTYDKFQVEGVSPLCGCYAQLQPSAWRGITFAARYLTIQRLGAEPLTEYILTAPEPTNTFWSSSGFRVGLTLFSFDIPSDMAFDPRAITKADLPSEYIVNVRKELPPEQFYLVFSKSELNVALLGDKPLCAWIPSDGSRISLKYEKKMSLATPVSAALREFYRPYTLSSEAEELQGVTMGLPLGDFLGPKIVLWWVDGAELLSKNGLFKIDHEVASKSKRIVAVLLNPPFSLRVAINSAKPTDIPVVAKSVQRSEVSDLFPAYTNRRSHGEVSLSIINPKEQVADFNEIYAHMKANELTTASEIPTDGYTYSAETIAMTFRYPAIPPNKGFNVFGPISNLKFNSALGSVLIGTRQHELTAPSEVELRHVQSLAVEGGVVPVPIQLDATDENHQELQLQAKSQIFINKESMNEKADEYRFGEYMTTLALIVSLVSGLLSIWSIVRVGK